jgi:uncharacterized membrane protein
MEPRAVDMRTRSHGDKRCARVCRERRNVAKTLTDARAVLGTLELLVGCILHTVATAAYLAIFGVAVGHLLLSLSSVAIAFAFVFGNSMRTIYESVVFLFIVHPYQVGDRCAADFAVLLLGRERCICLALW